jgi:hypothetical protein
MKYLVSAFLLFFAVFAAQGQQEKTIHQTFQVEEAPTILLELVGDYTIIQWAGNTVMTETRIELYDAPPAILNHFADKEQRYAIKSDTIGGSIKLYSADKKRDTIRTKNSSCTEIVKLKVFIPEDYEIQNQTTLVRTRHE